MIASMKGQVSYIDAKYVIIETGGIGYKVFLTADNIQGLTVGKSSSLWIHMVVRDDAMDLYGFTSKKEKDFFELLLTVSSIGPKSALNILGLIDIDTLASAIRSGSTAHLVKVSGIGRKTAEKIVLELRDKLGNMSNDDSIGLSAHMSSDIDAIEALKALGYDADEAREALKKIDKEIEDTGAKVKAALKILM